MPSYLSEEGRQRLSELAKERHRNGGWMTPEKIVENAKKGNLIAGRGRSKKQQRITKRVADAAEEEHNTKAIIEVFRDAIHPNQPMSIRLKGAEVWARIAADHHKTEVQELAADHAQHSREELIELLRAKLTTGPTANIIRGQIEAEAGIIEADVVEDDGPDAAAA